METINVYIESGKKKIFAGAVDWPGWCRSGRDEGTALQALIDYGPRYARVLQRTGIGLPHAAGIDALKVIERHDGNTTTDFGSPAIILDADSEPLDRAEYARLLAVLEACWQAFDRTVQQAAGRELRKGPRGGGRDLDKIVEHVIEADLAYLAKLAWKLKLESGYTPAEALRITRQAIQKALTVAVNQGLPEQGPRGGTLWPPRYFIRRVAWHVLDHAWEIDDRV